MISVVISLIIISRIGRSYGVEPPLDVSRIFIYPLATITAEKMPKCFKKHSRNKRFLSAGVAGNGLLLLWTVVAAFISMAFISNIRAILMISVYEDPVDTTEDIFKQGKTPIYPLGFWRKYLIESSDIWNKRVGK